MENMVRVRLAMGAQAAAFCKAHPDTNPATGQVAAKLIELSARAGTLLEQKEQGRGAASAAVLDKAAARRAVGEDLKALRKIVREAERKHPEVAIHRKSQKSRASVTEYYANARVALDNATALKEILVPFGLSDELLASLTQGLDTLKAAIDHRLDAVGARITARADLELVSHQIVGVVNSLDAVHAVRFKQSPEVLAAWKSARNVAWPAGSSADPTAPAPAPVTPSTPVAPVARVDGSKAA